MPVDVDPAIEIQRRYYADTAQRYETMHAQEGAADPCGLNYVIALLRAVGVKSVLDVGTANGRGSRKLKDAFPEAFVCGLDPVSELLAQAGRLGYREGVSLLQGTGGMLPFGSQTFDAVCEFGILHHVPEPARVINEMLRVARKAVLVADSNRFGQGSWIARLLKLAMYKAGLWNTFIFLRTRGKRYTITDGDGLAYSYSVFDSYHLIAEWADRIVLLPSGYGASASWFHPLLTSSGIYLLAFKEGN